MKQYKKYLTWFIIITTVSCFSTVIIYFCKFHTGLSNSNSDWGTFGDYIGGILNPIIGLLNLTAVIAIGYVVSKWDDNRHKNEFLYTAYKELADRLRDVPYSDIPKIKSFQDYLGDFWRNNMFLIPEHRQDELQSLCIDLHQSVNGWEWYLDEKTNIKMGKLYEMPINDDTMQWRIDDYFVEMLERARIELINYDKRKLLTFIQHILAGEHNVKEIVLHRTRDNIFDSIEDAYQYVFPDDKYAVD